MGYLRVHELQPGMRLKNDLINEEGKMFLAEGTILTDNLINRMQNFGIRYVNVEEEKKSRKPEEEKTVYQIKEERFLEIYKNNYGLVKNILDGVRNGSDVKLKDVRDTVNTFITLVMEDDNIVPKLHKIHDVDEYTYYHSINVSLLSIMIGKWMKLKDMDLKKLAYSGVFHDIGKSRVPLEILNKPGPLDEKEWKIMKKHPVYGYNILKNTPGISRDVLAAVIMHHERVDGRGYPLGLKGDRIHPLAKIVTVADIFDAMLSDRVHKKKEPIFNVVNYIGNSGFTFLDPVVTRVFLRGISEYFVGNMVRLSDGRIGQIVYKYQHEATKVVVKVNDGFIDLVEEAGITVVEIIG